MLRIKLLRMGKDVKTDKIFAVIHLWYDGHPMKGDGETLILEEGVQHQDGREIHLHEEKK